MLACRAHFLALGLGLLSCGADPAPAAPPRPRHLILISIDTLRRDHVGLNGYERDTTPTLDDLAPECLVFDRAYTTWTWTLIAHMGLLTGLHASQHGVWRKDAVLSEEIPTLAQRLSAAGFHCVGLHFPGWLDPRYGFDRGFDVYASHRDAEEAEAHMLAALAARPADRPLFLFVHLFDAHNAPLPERGPPYDPPAPFDAHFLPDARERLASAPAKELWDEDGGVVSAEQHEAIVALYDGGIRYLDHKLGEWLARWRSEGLFDDALLVVTSDHGEGLHQRGGRYGGHGAFYEEGLRVPLLVRFPDGRFAGERVDSPVSLVDLVPTLLDAFDLPPDPKLPGWSLLAGRPADALVIAEHPRKGAEVLYAWPTKLVRAPKLEAQWLRDLAQDPDESAPPVARTEPLEALLERAAAERARWSRPAAPGTARPLNAEAERMLEAIGYGGAGDH